MAKAIKFNLICDDKPIRTLEDLQQNFVIEDILKCYDSKLLHRWLNVRGYEKEHCEVSKITSTDEIEIITELIRIFEVEKNKKEVEKACYSLKYLREEKEQLKLYKEQKTKKAEIVGNYQKEYYQLRRQIIENPKDVSLIKANIKTMAENYGWAFLMDHNEFFYDVYDISPLAVMCLLMNESTRDLFLPIKASRFKEEAETEEEAIDRQIKESIAGITEPHKRLAALLTSVQKEKITKSAAESEEKYTYDTDNTDDIRMRRKSAMYADIVKIIGSAKRLLGDNLLSYSGQTDGYWKDLEAKGKKYMVISIGSGDYVRSAGVQGGDLSAEDVKNQFLILDGIDYKSNSSTKRILYMEV